MLGLPSSNFRQSKLISSILPLFASFNLFDIEDIFLGQCASKLLKAKEGKLVKLDKDIKFLIKHDFVSFTLVLTNQKIDLIAPNYITFTYFDAAIKSIIKSPDEVSLALKTIN